MGRWVIPAGPVSDQQSRISPRGEGRPVSDATDRSDVLRVCRIALDLPAQRADMHIKNIAVAVEGNTPHLVQQLMPRHGSPHSSGQRIKKRRLFAGQGEETFIKVHLSGSQADPEFTRHEDILLSGATVKEGPLHPQKQLRCFEWPHQKVCHLFRQYSFQALQVPLFHQNQNGGPNRSWFFECTCRAEKGVRIHENQTRETNEVPGKIPDLSEQHQIVLIRKSIEQLSVDCPGSTDDGNLITVLYVAWRGQRFGNTGVYLMAHCGSFPSCELQLGQYPVN